MKRIFQMILSGLIVIMVSVSVYSKVIDIEIQKAIIKVTEDYTKLFPDLTVKKGLAVLAFKEESENAKNGGIGNTIREIISAQIPQNRVFFLIDREALEASVNEMKLTLSGIIDEENAVKVGEMAGVQAFILGSVSDLKEDFLINLKLIDVQSGKVVSITNFQIPQKDLYDKKRELAFSYISKYGMGLNYQLSSAVIRAPNDRRPVILLNDVFINYRPALWLNFRMGISYMSFNGSPLQNIALTSIYPGITKYSNNIVYPRNMTVKYETGIMDIFGPYIGADYNWTPVEFFTLGIGVSYNIFLSPLIRQTYSPGYIYDTSDGRLKNTGVLYIEQELKSIGLGRIELKPQFFISPRVTLGLYLCATIGGNVRVEKTTINSEYIDFPNREVRTNGYQVVMDNKYLGIDTKLYSDGRDIEGLNFIGGMAWGMSCNFYY